MPFFIVKRVNIYNISWFIIFINFTCLQFMLIVRDANLTLLKQLKLDTKTKTRCKSGKINAPRQV